MSLARVAVVQVGLTLAGAALLYPLEGGGAVKALCYGGAAALTNTLLLRWRMRSSARQPGRKPQEELFRLYRSSVERFFVVALLIAAGLGWLKLLPALMLAGFVIGQLVLVVSTITSGIEK